MKIEICDRYTYGTWYMHLYPEALGGSSMVVTLAAEQKVICIGTCFPYFFAFLLSFTLS